MSEDLLAQIAAALHGTYPADWHGAPANECTTCHTRARAIVAALAGDTGDLPARMAEALNDIPTGIDGIECRIPNRRHREMIAAVAVSVRWEDNAVTVARLAQAEARADKATALLRDLVDADDCWFDHHGGCQAHGYLSLEPGERCPQAEAQELIARIDGKETTDA